MSNYLSALETVWPFAAKKLQESIDKQHDALFADTAGQDKEKPLFAELWDWFITLMVLYFVLSFLNSIVKNRLQQQQA